MHRHKNVLFVFAHQDDECAVSTRIVRELEWNHSVFCVYLTDGAARGARPTIRDAESRRVLANLGVPSDHVFFLGSTHGFPDGGLFLHLEDALASIERSVGHSEFDRVYCLAYEGGHEDHDASHIVALAFARRRRLLAQTWQAPFYHGHRTPGKLFRVLHPLPANARTYDRRLPRGQAVKHSLLCWRFRSQWLTWLGLFPELLVRRGILRRETLQPVDDRMLRARPHPGPLLYERRTGLSYDEFRRHVDPFLDTHLT
jgi:LmbE family N-acetylglucosaminyl deacetylase